MNIQETIKKIQDAPGSIFTKEDVIKILNGVTNEGGKIPSLKELKEKILDSIENSISDVEEYVEKRWETNERSDSVTIEVELDIDTDGIISHVQSYAHNQNLNQLLSQRKSDLELLNPRWQFRR